ncbi:MAG: nucleotidyl transferase AbiEii/AbiGii toxin family protein [Propionibacteriaceae bacterium]|nr:nucleotidyl transferase AbiEii/AbiGii toxin family protein [Propionibacteriaceae bacterium]
MATSEEARVLNQRINAAARNGGVSVQRFRNRIAFQRMLARLAVDPSWVLKGGFSLEMRLGLAARATKDLDLWRLSSATSDPLEIQDMLQDALDRDMMDGFTFQVGLPSHVDIQDAEPSTWRVNVKTQFHRSLFASTRIDIVTTDTVDNDETEPLTVEPALSDVGVPFMIRAINLDRHAAEKYHACVRVYANDRPSTRVKDLVDLVLLIEGDWLHKPQLGAALVRVFQERNNAEPPSKLPDQPPQDWQTTYRKEAADTGVTVSDALEAWALVSHYYLSALEEKD